MKNLKILREEKKISQNKLAKDIGISQSNICEYEKGTVEATESVIIKLAQYFDVKVGYLLGTEEYDGTEIKPTTEQVSFNSTVHANYGIINNNQYNKK